MDREKFLDIIVNATPYTSRDEELIESMKKIHGYFHEIKEDYIKLVNVEPSDRLYSVVYNGDCTYVLVNFNQRQLAFKRKKELIEISVADDNFLTHEDIEVVDKIAFDTNGKLMSEKFSIDFSRELMANYLDFLV